jgi:hypothetical protein
MFWIDSGTVGWVVEELHCTMWLFKHPIPLLERPYTDSAFSVNMQGIAGGLLDRVPKRGFEITVCKCR